jgi:molybdate transport system ATP-binding protein
VLKVSVKKKQGRFEVDASFSVASAGVTALFGASGAGKTSVINMVAGLSRPDAGLIVVNSLTAFDSERGIDVPPERRRVGYVFQDGRIFPHLSVRSNLTYGMNLVPRDRRTIAFDEVVSLLGIDSLLSRRVANLSGGEKQRVAIGRALLTSPSLLLMDEPLASLDAARKAEVLPFIERLHRQLSIPILYVTHSLNEILNLADTLVLMDAGRVRSVGAVEDVANQLEFGGLDERYESGSVLATVVDHHDTADGLTHLRFGENFLKVPLFLASKGTKVRVHINSRDVALALSPPTRTSVQNIFPATVEGVSEREEAFVDVRLDIGSPITARITKKARRDLELTNGQHIFAMVKSVAISRGSDERQRI